MTTFIDGVNRVLRNVTMLGGDDDDITSFSNTQHPGQILNARLSIQSTLSYVVSKQLLAYEEVDGTITYVTDQRVYSLPSDFVRFTDDNPFLLEVDGSGVSENTTVNLYPGGEEALRRQVLDYKTQSGSPIWFYFVGGTTKKIGLYQVPDSSVNGQEVSFSYQNDVYVENESDNLPFHTTQEAHAFLQMASRWFQFLHTGQPIEGLENDVIFKAAERTLNDLINGVNPNNEYGFSYS